MARIRERLEQFVVLATSRNDIVLALFLVSIIFMMILPLPTWVVDVLIGTNMTISAMLLMVAMYLRSPLSFSSFPTVLLVTTLFRLGISIATTRLILLQGDAGHIIDTFGNFVVGGNLVVGLVVFLILTIVQFVVITKGSERVAEVAARFSLDAMPGKQMSIDGDLRAGSIDVEEAKRRRDTVQQESQLYGAMDGAMKFVKGDAIAGLIIVAVNLLGGILIGTTQRGLTAGAAVKTYSILTIGDGLIAQIPALFIAISAGVIVTRVHSSNGNSSNVGRDIGTQILAEPRALLIAAAVAIGMGMIPGMPAATFGVLGAIIGTIGLVLHQGSRRVINESTGELTEVPALLAATDSAPKTGANRMENEFFPTVPLMLDASPRLKQAIDPEQLNDELLKIRRALYFDLGVPFPGIQLRFNENLPAGNYKIMLSEVPVSHGKLRSDHVLARESTQNLEALQIKFESDENFLPNIPTVWIHEKHKDILLKAGVSLLEPSQIITYHLSCVLKKYSSDFLGIEETNFLLSSMTKRFPELVNEVTRAMPTHKIAEVLQRLVSEEIPIRNLRTIFEALIEWSQKERDSVLLTEYVRLSLKRHICHKYVSAQNVLAAYLLSNDAEETVRTAIRQTSAGSYLALDSDISERLVVSIKEAVGDIASAVQKPVLLTSMDIRRYMRKMVERDLYDLPVVSYQELTPEVNIQPLMRIEF